MKKKHKKIKPETVILQGFLSVIILGTLLLMLPVSSASGRWTDPVTALFSATTCTCVTGLTVVDTFSYWSFFGKIILLLLIQIGGFGVVTLTTGFLLLLQKRLTLKNLLLLESAFNLDNMHGLVRFMLWVVKATFAVEGIGALLSMPVFVPEYGPKGIGISVFHSVSSFCNAGIDILGKDSLCGYRDNLWLNVVTMLLIILGGLGFLVWQDLLLLFRRHQKEKLSFGKRLRRLSLHSKITLVSTGSLILFGALLFLLFEWNNPGTIGAIDGTANRITAGFFQSVTTRTAGFYTFSQKDMHSASCLLSSVLMFIGGSSIGTAGGIKTSTVSLLVLSTTAVIRRRKQIAVFGRAIPGELVRRAISVITVSFLTLLGMVGLLCFMTGDGLGRILYEVSSALGTAGLSCGVTAELNVFGQLLLILCMYLGRVGPMSLTIAFSNDDSGIHIQLPEQKITIG